LSEFRALGKHTGVKCISCIGRVGKFKENLANVSSGNYHVAVGTLGRVQHFFKQKEPAINGDSIKMFVIDEADKMVMERDFKEELKLVSNHMNERKGKFFIQK